MNRHIQFRAKSITSGKWIYGNLVANEHGAAIANVVDHRITAIEVDPDTVQQRTNTYHQGRFIWEGDFFSNPAHPKRRYIVTYDICFEAFQIICQQHGQQQQFYYKPLGIALAQNPSWEYAGNIADEKGESL
ncbi:MAG: hypothetical protein ACI4AM_06500 [Muribaculaceae bacterium]